MIGAPFLYRTVQRVLRASAPVVGQGRSKVARGLEGRRDAARSMIAWAEGHPDRGPAPAWFHAPSVGEGLQARAVMDALLVRRPEVPLVYTHFSPSAQALAGKMPAAWAGYLPWDLVDEVVPVLQAVRPGLLVFTKTEVWPVLVERAALQGVPVTLVGGTVPEGARRARWPGRSLLRETWGRLSMVAAMTDADAQGFEALGVRSSALHVTGDPGVDSAAMRARSAGPDAAYLRPFREDPRPTLVAGSTWPSDMAVLADALQAVRARVPGIRVIVAPHEPDETTVSGLVRAFRESGWQASTLADVEERGALGVDAVVVDRVGVLAHLYSVGDAAYVGGGFHAAGLHSVLEPAAARLPVTFGPGHANARAAAHLLDREGARVAEDAGALAGVLLGWFEHDDARDYAAGRAFGYIDAHLGAAERTAALLDDLMPSA